VTAKTSEFLFLQNVERLGRTKISNLSKKYWTTHGEKANRLDLCVKMITKEKRKCLSVYPLHCGWLVEVEIGPSGSYIYIPICNISRNICMKKIEE